MNLILLLSLIGCFFASAAFGKIHKPQELRLVKLQSQELVLEKIFEGSDVVWGMDFISDSKVIFTEKNGKILSLDLLTGKSAVLGAVPNVSNSGQGGLLDIKVHPDFKNNKWVYVSIAHKGKEGRATGLARAELRGAKFGNWQQLFVGKPASGSGLHFGSRIVFHPDGRLFLTAGERGAMQLAQDLSSTQGKVLRLNADGSIPKDNPFVGKTNVEPAIWSYGHRNPQGMALHPITKEIYVSEHGPRGGDEINLIKKGANYGWPVISYGNDYGSNQPIGEGTNKKGMEQPLKYFVPSIAPSGLVIYSGRLIPEWKEAFISGALALQHLNIVHAGIKNAGKELPNCERRLFENMDERVRSVVEGPEGFVYFSTDSGVIYRLRPQLPHLQNSMKKTKDQKTAKQSRTLAGDSVDCPPYSEEDISDVQNPNPAEPLVASFENVQRSILAPYCLSCHIAGSSIQPKLDSHAEVLKVVTVGKANNSKLVQVLENKSMPPSFPLSAKYPELIQMLKEWINQGAKP